MQFRYVTAIVFILLFSSIDASHFKDLSTKNAEVSRRWQQLSDAEKASYSVKAKVTVNEDEGAKSSQWHKTKAVLDSLK